MKTLVLFINVSPTGFGELGNHLSEPEVLGEKISSETRLYYHKVQRKTVIVEYMTSTIRSFSDSK